MTTTRGQHLIGKVIGSCVIEQFLGHGGSSAVFLAQQSAPERKVAIKIFLPRSHMNAQVQKEFYHSFLQEAEAASRLDHPNILPIYAYGEQDGLPYIIMPYMPGGTLSEYIARHGCLSLQQVQWYLEQIASALDYAHQKHGYVHCDVKPANILLDSDGSVVLTDFGIAHIMQQESDSNNSKSPAKSPETLMGTPDYISPEQALGLPLDGRSDIYSLGITLFYLLTGRLPFRADSTIAVALLHVHEPPPSLSLLRADISPYTDSVIQKALAKQPGERYQTAGEFSEAFTRAIEAAGRVYHIDPDGKPAMLPEEHSTSRGDMARWPLVSAKPVVRIKPTTSRAFSFQRVMLAVVLLLSVTVGAAVAGGLLVSHLAAAAPHVHVQLTIPPNIVGDDLSDNADWPTGPIGGAFYFTGEQYHIQNKLAHNVALALYANHEYSNFRLTVTTTELHGSGNGADYYGIAFRGAVDQSHYYLFEVVSWGGGQYQFLRYDGDGHWITLADGPIPSLVTRLGQSNTITVAANGHTFRFWINGRSVGSPITDASKTALPTGEVGFSVEQEGTEIMFSHLYITTSN